MNLNTRAGFKTNHVSAVQVVVVTLLHTQQSQ